MSKERNALDSVNKDMQAFHNICQDNKDFVNFLKSPIIKHLRKAEILQKMFKGKFNEITLMIFDIITRKNRENVLPNVAEEFTKLYNAEKGIQEATITTTFPLDDTMRKDVIEIVKEISGMTPVLKENIDSEIVGGYVLKLGDRQIDESLSGKLNHLKLKFKQKSNI